MIWVFVKRCVAVIPTCPIDHTGMRGTGRIGLQKRPVGENHTKPQKPPQKTHNYPKLFPQFGQKVVKYPFSGVSHLWPE